MSPICRQKKQSHQWPGFYLSYFKRCFCRAFGDILVIFRWNLVGFDLFQTILSRKNWYQGTVCNIMISHLCKNSSDACDKDRKGLGHPPAWRMSIIAVTKEIKPGHVNTVTIANAKIYWLQSCCFWTKTGETDATVAWSPAGYRHSLLYRLSTSRHLS